MDHRDSASASDGQTVDVNGFAAVFSAIVLGTVGVLSFIIQPGIVQGFVTELGLTEPDAVNLAGIEMLGVALATIALAVIGNRLNWRWVVVLGLLVAAIGNVYSANTLGSDDMWLARFVAGFGHGMIISISFTLIGVTRHTERNLALYIALLLSYGALGLWYLPTFLKHFGLAEMFYGFAVVCFVCLVTARFVPRFCSSDDIINPEARQLGRALLVIALLGVLAYNLAQGIAWAILFLVGIGAGHSEQPVADALFLSQVLAIIGALASVVLAERINNNIAIAVGILGGGASIALLFGQPSYAIFLVAVCGFNILWNFVMPFILGKVCDFDTSGRIMSVAIALQMIGLGGGPILAAPLIGDGSYLLVEMVCVAFFISSYILLLPAIVAHRRLMAGNKAS